MLKYFKLFTKFGFIKSNTKILIVSRFPGLSSTNKLCKPGDFKDQSKLTFKSSINKVRTDLESWLKC